MVARRAVALALAALAACRPASELGPPDASSRDGSAPVVAPAWPPLPRTSEERAARIAASTVRAPVEDRDAGAPTVASAVARAEARGLERVVAGYAAVRAYLAAWATRAPDRDAYLLLGTLHDSGEPLRALRRLVGPPSPFTHVALEQLHADGRWAGAPEAAQRGESEPLARYLATGDLAALDEVARAHATHDYAAWKYDYEEDVLDVVREGRALGRPVLACDMPRPLQALLGAGPSAEEHALRLRELHCALALRDALGPAPRPAARVAMLFGDAHVGPRAFPRLVPHDVRVLALHVLGRTRSAGEPAVVGGRRLVLNDPVLVELDDEGREAALLLPDASLGGEVERARSARDAGPSAATVTLEADRPGELVVASRRATSPGALEVPPGEHTYVFRAAGAAFVGALAVAPGDAFTLAFDARSRSTRIERAAR